MPIMKVPDTGVTVRMYRAGLGDCFLLAFRGKDRKPVLHADRLRHSFAVQGR